VAKKGLEITSRMLAVFDERPAAARAVLALLQAGFARDAVLLLQGPEAATRLRGSGSRGGPITGFVRMLVRLPAEQSADLATYEAAVSDGRAVVAVHTLMHGLDRAELDRAAAVLRESGGHTIHYFGRLGLEKIAP
jgi:hypothetical protein